MRRPLSEPELYRLSRDRGLLARLAVIVASGFVVLAFFCSLSAPRTAVEAIDSQLGVSQDSVATNEEVLGALRRTLLKLRGRVEQWDIEAFRTNVIEPRIEDPGVQALFLAYSRAALLPATETALDLEFLQSEAREIPRVRFANELLGDLAKWEGNVELALEHYRIEAEFPDAEYVRSEIMTHLIDEGDRDALVRLMKDPTYELDHHQYWLKLGVILKDPGFIFRGIVLHDYGDLPFVVWFITIPVTFVWFWILKKICFVPLRTYKPLILGGIGVLLGVASTTATLFAVVWQEHIWGFELNGEMMNDFLVYVLGVGVREETIKLLFLLPLVPWLYKSRDPKTILLAASCVGLGFAAQENIGYFHRYGGTLSRFITANFFHITLTGTLGFAFCRFLYTPRSEWNRFLATYIIVILVHGAYDFIGTHPEGGFFAIVLFCFSAFFFFDLVEKHCTANRQTISPLSVFVIGCSVIFGCALVATAATTPSFHTALSQSGNELLGMIPLMFLYINRFRNA